MVVRSKPSPGALFPSWVGLVGDLRGCNPTYVLPPLAAYLSGGRVDELWTMEVLEMFALFLTLLEDLVFDTATSLVKLVEAEEVSLCFEIMVEDLLFVAACSLFLYTALLEVAVEYSSLFTAVVSEVVTLSDLADFLASARICVSKFTVEVLVTETLACSLVWTTSLDDVLKAVEVSFCFEMQSCVISDDALTSLETF